MTEQRKGEIGFAFLQVVLKEERIDLNSRRFNQKISDMANTPIFIRAGITKQEIKNLVISIYVESLKELETTNIK